MIRTNIISDPHRDINGAFAPSIDVLREPNHPGSGHSGCQPGRRLAAAPLKMEFERSGRILTANSAQNGHFGCPKEMSARSKN
jgi:hypothetical protein